MTEPTPTRAGASPVAFPASEAPPVAAWPVEALDPAPPRPGPLRRLLPRPWTALWLWLTWMLLNQTTEPGHLLLGAVLALVLAGWVPAPLPASGVRRRGAWRHPVRFARLGGIVLWDIVVANLQVAARILGLTGELKPRFVWIPLDLAQPHAVTLLAGIITMTPGTLSCELSDDRTHLLVHGLDVDDPAELVAQIKARYEAPIRELFE
jgi:multicomponent K+:H+ antiporter subunit E